MPYEGDTPPKNYAVGRGKPPRHSRFKPGESGNRKGRPRGSKNFATILDEELRSPIVITEGGKKRKVSKRAALAKQLVSKSVSGDLKATALVMGEERARSSQEVSGPGVEALQRPEDVQTFQNMLARLRAADAEQQNEASHPDRSAPPAEADQSTNSVRDCASETAQDAPEDMQSGNPDTQFPPAGEA
jgi:uncharacterized protein (DUF2336 family)